MYPRTTRSRGVPNPRPFLWPPCTHNMMPLASLSLLPRYAFKECERSTNPETAESSLDVWNQGQTGTPKTPSLMRPAELNRLCSTHRSWFAADSIIGKCGKSFRKFVLRGWGRIGRIHAAQSWGTFCRLTGIFFTHCVSKPSAVLSPLAPWGACAAAFLFQLAFARPLYAVTRPRWPGRCHLTSLAWSLSPGFAGPTPDT
jgi:hypothetical protein